MNFDVASGERVAEGVFGTSWRVGNRLIKVAPADWKEKLPWGVPRAVEVMQRGLVHPCIPAFEEHGLTDDGRPWLARRFVEGLTVREVLLSDSPPSKPHALQITSAVGQALQAAHALGVLHCDVNVQNVVLPTQGTPASLLDWGIALLVDPTGPRIHRERLRNGTLGYAAPEQLQHRRQGPFTDVWGLGVLLFCMIYRTTPFGRSDVLRNHLELPKGHRAINDLLRRALAPAPNERCDMESFVAAVQHVARALDKG